MAKPTVEQITKAYEERERLTTLISRLKKLIAEGHHDFQLRADTRSSMRLVANVSKEAIDIAAMVQIGPCEQRIAEIDKQFEAWGITL